MNIGYPDTKNKQRSGNCGCGSPLYMTTDFTPEVIETSYEGNLDLSGLENVLTKKKTKLSFYFSLETARGHHKKRKKERSAQKKGWGAHQET